MPGGAYTTDDASRAVSWLVVRWTVAVTSTKQLVRELLDELPDDGAIEDVVADLGRRWGKNREL